MIFQISYIVFILFIWFNTNSFVEYSTMLGTNKIFKIDLYKEYLLINPLIKYNEYLLIKHNRFLVRLITCKPCLCFWITLLSIIISNSSFLFLPLIYLLSYITYKSLDKYVF